MKSKGIKKFLFYRSHILGWLFLTLVVVCFFLELSFFTSYNYEIVSGANRAGLRTRFLLLEVEKQREIIQTQEEYIKTLKASNRMLEIRKETLETENETLQNEIISSVGPMLEQLGYRIFIFGSRVYCEKGRDE